MLEEAGRAAQTISCSCGKLESQLRASNKDITAACQEVRQKATQPFRDQHDLIMEHMTWAGLAASCRQYALQVRDVSSQQRRRVTCFDCQVCSQGEAAAANVLQPAAAAHDDGRNTAVVVASLALLEDTATHATGYMRSMAELARELTNVHADALSDGRAAAHSVRTLPVAPVSRCMT
jgi:hypothetical protein